MNQFLKTFKLINFETIALVTAISLFFIYYLSIIQLISLHKFSYYDLGIYSDALSRIQWNNWNPLIPGRNIRIFLDHFDPILIPLSFFKKWISPPYLGVTAEFLALSSCWFPLHQLKKSGFLTPKLFHFSYVFILLNHAMAVALEFPFHPTTFAALPLCFLLSSYLRGNWKATFIWFIALCSCREEFPLIGVPLGILFLIERKFKVGLLFLGSTALLLGSIFFLRPLILGPTSDYGFSLLSRFISDPLGNLRLWGDRRFIYGWIECLAPLVCLIQTQGLKSHRKFFLKILFITSPIFGIRYASHQWGFHYGTAAIISLFFALIPSIAAIPTRSWPLKVAYGLSFLFFLGPLTRTISAAFIPCSLRSHKAHCLRDPERLHSIERAQTWIDHSSASRVLLQNNLAASQIRFRAPIDIYSLASPQSSADLLFDAFLTEKPPHGDPWPTNEEEINRFIAQLRQDPSIQIIQDDHYVFLATGKIRKNFSLQTVPESQISKRGSKLKS